MITEEVRMPIIRSISSLRNHTREIASICHEEDEPVFLTTNGKGDLVVMSLDHYGRLKAQIELIDKLNVAELQAARGETGITHAKMIKRLKQRMHAQ